MVKWFSFALSQVVCESANLAGFPLICSSGTGVFPLYNRPLIFFVLGQIPPFYYFGDNTLNSLNSHTVEPMFVQNPFKSQTQAPPNGLTLLY